ncbi:O-methyltransferase [Truncatella angustata]|uniref:O-methyltransferase n=1 Tax=Truncatella angustata TaxID=152316 RepID=A0A9P8UGT6_9PEZI|nr:O-methyltransferase [Truncatella angustata]KAH6651878.1 O-methyltransferase [Truncatella angustata]
MAAVADSDNNISFLDGLQPESFTSDVERYAAKEAARKLLARLETPFERSWASSFETPVLVAGLQVCQDLGIWSKWSELDKENTGASQSLDNILSMVHKDVDPNLLRRFLRHIAALYVLKESGPDSWKPTSFSLAMGDRRSYINQTEPLDKTKFDNYRDLFGDDFFAYCQKNPEVRGSFIGLMTALRNHKMDWTEVFDTNRIVEGAKLDGSKPLLVDVGGAHGIDSARFLTKHPDLPADVITLQDLPDVIETHSKEKLDSRIRRMPYNFFTPQPIKGARAYFFHAVPHDWPDADCVRISENIKAAMENSYSKLIIYEVVLPARGATSLMTTLDLQLMNCTSGLERMEAHWKDLLARAGFKIIGISSHPRAVESVIEAELA